MKIFRLFVLVVLVSVLTSFTAVAQSSPYDLQIRAKVVRRAAPEETKISISFENTSDHRVSFPKPVLFCHKLPGALLVLSKFTPADPNSGQLKLGMGCAACQGIHTHEPSIVEQTKDWLVLGPGQSIDVQDQLSHAMIIAEAGTYRVRVIYSAPAFDAQERKELDDAGISVPSPGDYYSNSVIFEIEARDSDAN